MIKKGDKFECIKTVIMDDDDEIAYVEGYVYCSEQDNCITSNQGEINHEWSDDFEEHFRKIEGWKKEETAYYKSFLHGRNGVKIEPDDEDAYHESLLNSRKQVKVDKDVHEAISVELESKPELFRSRSTFTQKQDTWSDSEELQQSIKLEKIESGNGHYFLLKSSRWAFDDLKELTDLIERFDSLK
jgi:hypothetical protein